MARQIINIGTTPNDGTGDTVRNAFDKVNDNFDEVYNGLFVPLSGTTEGNDVTGQVTFGDDAPAVFKSSNGADDYTAIDGTIVLIQGRNSDDVLQTLQRVCNGGQPGSIVRDNYYYNEGRMSFKYPILNPVDSFDVNWPAKGGTVAFLDDITGGGATDTDELPEGTTNLYFTAARVRAALLDGLSTATGGIIAAGDSVLQAFGKLQNQINKRIGIIASNTATSATVTGTTANTLTISKMVPGGTLATGDNLVIKTRSIKTGTNGVMTQRIYVNTVDSLTGATLLGTQQGSAANLLHGMIRTGCIKSATETEFVSPTVSTSGDEVAVLSGGSVTNINIDHTVDQYYIVALQLANAGDSAVTSYIKVFKE